MDFNKIRKQAEDAIKYGSNADSVSEASLELEKFCGYIIQLLDHIEAADRDKLAAWNSGYTPGQSGMFKAWDGKTIEPKERKQ